LLKQVTTFIKDVSLYRPFINANGVDQVTYDIKKQKIKILNCKNLKFKKISSINKSLDNKRKFNNILLLKEDKLVI